MVKQDKNKGENEMTYKLTNQRYGNESVEVTIEELQALLRDVFGDDETKLEERSDGIYEVDGELVAKSIWNVHERRDRIGR